MRGTRSSLMHACMRVYTSGIRRAQNSHRSVSPRRSVGVVPGSGGEETSRCERRELPNWNVLFHLLFGKREMSSRAARRRGEDAGARPGKSVSTCSNATGFMRAREKESATSSLAKRLVAFIEKLSSSIAARTAVLSLRETRRFETSFPTVHV